jgi:hypothetical protein
MDMEAAIKDMIANIDTALAAEREALASVQRQSIETMADLLSKRARLSGMLADAPMVGLEKLEEKPTEKPDEKPTAVIASAPEVIRPKTSDFIMQLLTDAGEAGLSGPELQTAAAAVGLTKGAVDKSRTRLKEAQMIDLKSGKWFRVSRPAESKAA